MQAMRLGCHEQMSVNRTDISLFTSVGQGMLTILKLKTRLAGIGLDLPLIKIRIVACAEDSPNVIDGQREAS